MSARGLLAIASAAARAARASAVSSAHPSMRTGIVAVLCPLSSAPRRFAPCAPFATASKGDVSPPPNASSPALDGPHASSSSAETPSSSCVSSEDVTYARNEVDEALEECLRGGSVADLSRALDIVRDHGDEFTERNVSTALRAIGALAEAHPGERAADSAQFEALVDMTVHGLRRMSLSQLAQAVRDAARAGLSRDKLYDEIARHVVDRLSDASPEDVLAMLRGLHRADQNPSVLLFEKLGKRLQEERKTLTPEEIDEINNLYTAFGYDSPF